MHTIDCLIIVSARLFDREDVCNRGLRSDFVVVVVVIVVVVGIRHEDTCVKNAINGRKRNGKLQKMKIS